MKRKHRKKKSAARSVAQMARKLARAHTSDLGTRDPETRRSVEYTVGFVAAGVPFVDGVIQWEGIDVPRLFEAVSDLSRPDQETIAQHLMGFYYWLAVQHLASIGNVAEILDELADQFPESGNLILLHQCSRIGLAGGLDVVLGGSQPALDRATLN